MAEKAFKKGYNVAARVPCVSPWQCDRNMIKDNWFKAEEIVLKVNVAEVVVNLSQNNYYVCCMCRSIFSVNDI